jgi:hypothetical protein
MRESRITRGNVVISIKEASCKNKWRKGRRWNQKEKEWEGAGWERYDIEDLAAVNLFFLFSYFSFLTYTGTDTKKEARKCWLLEKFKRLEKEEVVTTER